MIDVVFFHLPSVDEPKRTIFAVSCLQQVESSQYKGKDESVTRSSVLKSICVLSAVPLFGLISSKVALTTQVWFGQKDFGDVDLLKDLYKSLSAAITSPICPDISVLCIDLDIRQTVLKFGKKIIRLFKALLLEPRLMFLIEPTAEMSKVILGFLSLFPGMLEKGLLLSAISPHLSPPPTPASRKSFVYSEAEEEENIPTKFDPSVVQGSIDLISQSLVTDSHGFPLAIFGPENACLPYVSVTYLERLPLLSSYLIGCTNILFLHKCPHDILVEHDKTEVDTSSLEVVFKDKVLKKIVKSTYSDKKFINWMLKTIDQDTKSGDPYFAGSNWVASDEWIREQFRQYLLGLLSGIKYQDDKVQESYGETFIAAWKRKLSFTVWQKSVENSKDFPRILHPGEDPSFAGNFQMSGNIFGSGGLANLSGSTLMATAVNFGSKADGAKKFLMNRAGGFMSSMFGHDTQGPAKNGQVDKPKPNTKPYSNSVSDLTVHRKASDSSTEGGKETAYSRPKAKSGPPIDEWIDDRGAESFVVVDQPVVKQPEDESQL